MPKGTAFTIELMRFLFSDSGSLELNDKFIDSSGSPHAANFYFALHTASPHGSGDLQSTNEVAYPEYTRMAVARGGAFTVNGTTGVVTMADNLSFPQAVNGFDGDTTVTHFSIGMGGTGVTSAVLYSGELDPHIPSADMVTPVLSKFSFVSED